MWLERFTVIRWVRLLACLVAAGFAGCGGGGSSDRPATNTAPTTGATGGTEPFGLTIRDPLAALSIPLSGGALGTYDLDASFPGLSFPAAIFLGAVPGENRLVVAQQSGFVRAFTDDPAASSSQLVLDVSGRISVGGEKGLLGLAFDPDFVSNRYLYVHQSIAGSGGPGVEHVARISRFTWDAAADLVSLGSEKVILEIDQPYSNHNGGMLAFGPDGYLYFALGDGGSGGDPQNNAQTTSNLLGSMLRIDVHPANPADAYDVPPDNPFVGQAGFLPEIYAYGLRNPFRFSFDRSTGRLWAGDVGQGAREEVDIIEAGENHGWRVYEGNLAYDDSLNTLPVSAFTFPVLDYGRSDGRAVIGGYVYRGTRVPSLQGRYLYGDYGTGNIWALDWDAGSASVTANELIANAGGVTSFGEDTSADVHVVTGGGTLYQFRELSGGTPTDPPLRLSQTGLFDDLASLDPASGLIEYELNQPFWSDGTLKRRWLGLPDGERIGFDATEAWSFPLGTVIVKHFEIALTEGDPNSQRRLETRLLVRRDDGWRGFTYRWNGAETDADLLTGPERETITVTLAGGGTEDQLYEYPSRTDCLGCHTGAAGFALGVRTRQLNREFAYPAATDNQLRSWNNVDLFTTDIGAADAYDAFPTLDDTSVPVAERARAYLDVNCAQCHQPGGPAPTVIDLRFDTALADMNVLDVAPSAGNLGVTDVRIVARGDRSRSVLWLRMGTLDGNRMPTLGSHKVDDAAVALIGDWIDGL
jgi:uncharacterized repeat protein (TIGR03806 family)